MARKLRAGADLTDGFRETLKRVTEKLRWIHGTDGEVFLLAASGTGAMEAALVSTVSPMIAGSGRPASITSVPAWRSSMLKL